MKLERGHVSSTELTKMLKPLRRDDFFRILFDGLVFLLSIFLTWIGFALAITGFSWAAMLFYPIILLFVARQFRAIELIVHDASHYNFLRRPKPRNDWIADLLFAAPVSQTVDDYRSTHLIHHKEFGGTMDPCRRRMEELARVNPQVRDRGQRVLRPSLRYISSYYASVAPSRAGRLAFTLWHLVVGSVCISIFSLASNVSGLVAICAWILVWAVPLLTSLPILRMHAERDEHDYFNGNTEFSATITSVGFLRNLIFHPWNDAYHLLHHLYPNIPQTRHRRAHHLLDAHDPAYRDRRTNGPA